MSKTILINNIKGEKLSKLEALCKMQNIRIKKVAHALLGQPVGFLANAVGVKKTGSVYKGGALPDEMLVFADFDDKDLDGFLAGYKEAGIEPIALKAVVTPTNMGWTFVELYHELVQERKAYESAQKAVERADL